MIENFSWLNVFREMGAKVKDETMALMASSSAGRPLGKGASGDTTLAVDKRAEDAIVSELEKIHAEGAEFTFISEELGERRFGGEGVIILADPIDGSNNAKYGLPFYATALALATGRKLSDTALGYVVNLATGDEFWAVKGEGAYKNGIKIKTSAASSLGMLNYECSFPKRDLSAVTPLLLASKKIRCLGSIALDLVSLAAGMTDAVAVPSPSRSFDYAAGWLIVNEAGGVVTDTSGRPIDDTALGVERTVPILAAANHGLHEKALAALGGR